MMPFGLRTPVVAVLLHVTGILTGGRHGLHVVSMCLPLANTSVCTPWQQGAVNVSSSMSIRDFDMALNAWAESNEHIAGFNAAYGCTWDGVGIRYAHSYGCAERLWMNDYACNSDLMAQDDATFRPLCTSSCQYYQASMGRILNDPTICAAEPTAAQSDARSATLDYIASFCANFSRSYNCSTLPSEHNRCGWANATVKGIVDYCAKLHDQ
ncbi:hypothetical protein CXG81DRAFT_27281 [Caulochytrium protostelioides]|uniref:FZ domain-containing protein n=1 Tax=Caulochytrium protostelioides TaxID=1555241 RepID=A0A4P9X4M9_9FUNG|nr:hypothetical protein CXG81DRAFT_27281 [Caulochytrium protostelioides]|eukprot:RKP00001.1 hypothetical protein CXG81DRAFT_27281 [Caulochytrium protostelioides]